MPPSYAACTACLSFNLCSCRPITSSLAERNTRQPSSVTLTLAHQGKTTTHRVAASCAVGTRAVLALTPVDPRYSCRGSQVHVTATHVLECALLRLPEEDEEEWRLCHHAA